MPKGSSAQAVGLLLEDAGLPIGSTAFAWTARLLGQHRSLQAGGKNCIIGANTLIPENKVIPDRSLVLGSPGKIIRQVTDKEIEEIKENAKHYVENYKRYKK